MGSRREEERNEKIIRGLMKLPPNRRCINCNSLGPQYVCTNFWTFVCMTCSGIHREFTHRVKSVSMAKFTSQEVEALQNGGNQRARETFLKDWDQQRQRLPDNSNAVKVREFIKAVYVEKRYAGGQNSDKPPRDMQNAFWQGIRGHEDETRRASSYHSYSQSPPYDYQYEERKYGKHVAALMRRPGSDRGLEGKISSFVYSPGHVSEHAYEDRFANEGSGGRASDFSVSSGGDPFRSDAQSPTFQKDTGFGSPPVHRQKGSLDDNLSRQSSNQSIEANLRRDADGIPRPQRTVSAGSFGSFDSSSMSLQSFNSSSLLDVVSETEQVSGVHHKKTSSYPQANIPGSPGNIDLFNTQNIPEPPVDLFGATAFSSPSQDLFQTHPKDIAPSLQSQSPQTPSPPLDLFADFAETQPSTAIDSRLMDPPLRKNDGWATFDSPESVAPNSAAEKPSVSKLPSSGGTVEKFDPFLTENPSVSKLPSGGSTVKNFDPFSTENPSVSKLPSGGGTVEKFDPLSSLDPGMNWSVSQKPNSAELPSSTPDPWLGAFSNVETATSNPQPWNAFSVSKEYLPSLDTKQPSEQLIAVQNPAISDQYLGYGAVQDFNNYANPRAVPSSGHPGFVSVPSDDVGPPFHPPMFRQMADASAPASENSYKSTNPFDLPYDSDAEQNTTFFDMSSLQATLPTAQLQPTLLGGVSPSWFPHNAVPSYGPAPSHGGVGFMPGQIPSPQIPNVPAQGPVASVGGNPFA